LLSYSPKFNPCLWHACPFWANLPPQEAISCGWGQVWFLGDFEERDSPQSRLLSQELSPQVHNWKSCRSLEGLETKNTSILYFRQACFLLRMKQACLLYTVHFVSFSVSVVLNDQLLANRWGVPTHAFLTNNWYTSWTQLRIPGH